MLKLNDLQTQIDQLIENQLEIEKHISEGLPTSMVQHLVTFALKCGAITALQGDKLMAKAQRRTTGEPT